MSADWDVERFTFQRFSYDFKSAKQTSEFTELTSKISRRSSKAPSSPGRNSKAVKSVGKRSHSSQDTSSSSSSRKETKPKPAATSSQPASPPPKKEGHIVSFSVDEIHRRPPGKTDWARLAKMTDEDIARAVAEDPDAAPIDMDWSDAKVYVPQLKSPTSLRLDPDVLAFFKAGGKGYQTRINAVLRSYMDHQRDKKRRERD